MSLLSRQLQPRGPTTPDSGHHGLSHPSDADTFKAAAAATSSSLPANGQVPAPLSSSTAFRSLADLASAGSEASSADAHDEVHSAPDISPKPHRHAVSFSDSAVRVLSLSRSSSWVSEDSNTPHRINSSPPVYPSVAARTGRFGQHGSQRGSSAARSAWTERMAESVRRAGLSTALSLDSQSEAESVPRTEPRPGEPSSRADEIQVAWKKLRRSRMIIISMKRNMNRHRKSLRSLREVKDEATIAFMDVSRSALAEGQQPAQSRRTLLQRFEVMQELQTQYTAEESAYERLELELEDQEESLENLEVNFFSLLVSGYPDATGPDSDPATDSDLSADSKIKPKPTIPVDLHGISADGPDYESHPYWKRLLSSVAVYRQVSEDLVNLRLRSKYLTDQLTLLENIGRSSGSELPQLVEEVQELAQDKKKEVEEAKRHMTRLYERCQAHGVTASRPSIGVHYALYGKGNLENIDLEDGIGDNLLSDSLAHPRFPVLLSCPDHVLRRPEPLTALNDLKAAFQLPSQDEETNDRKQVAIKEYGIHQLVYGQKQDDDNTDSVTRWLLYHLRVNPIEAEVLYGTFGVVTGLAIVDYEQWQLDVLQNWWKDKGRLPKPTDSDYFQTDHVATVSHGTQPLLFSGQPRTPLNGRSWASTPDTRRRACSEPTPVDKLGHAFLTLVEPCPRNACATI